MNKKQIKKSTSGITLIALVITIIVLLILAGISISMVVGENGIISLGLSTKEKAEMENEKEIIECATIKVIGSNKTGEIVLDELYNELKDYNIDIMEQNEYVIVIFKDVNRWYYVDVNGDVNYLDTNNAKNIKIKYVQENTNGVRTPIPNKDNDEYQALFEKYSIIPPEIEGYEAAVEIVEGSTKDTNEIEILYYLVYDEEELVFTEITVDDEIQYMVGDNSSTGGNAIKSDVDKKIKAVVRIPETYNGKMVSKIGPKAFQGMRNIIKLDTGDNVTDILAYAFHDGSGKSQIKEFTIGKKVKSVEDHSFWGCTSAKTIIFKNEDMSIAGSFMSLTSWTDIKEESDAYIVKDNILYSNDGKTLLIVPNGRSGEVVIDDNVEKINAWAFYLCANITSVVISDSVTSIGDRAFSQSGIQNLVIGKGIDKEDAKLGNKIFMSCNNLKCITYRNSNISKIRGKFEHCNAWTEIKLDPEDTIHKIENDILYSKDGTTLISCPQGKEAENIIIDSSVTRVENNAFCDCSKIESVTILGNKDTAIYLGSYSLGSNEIKKIIIGKDVKVSAIVWNAFINSTIETVVIDSPIVAENITSKNSVGRLVSNAQTIYIKDDITSVGSYVTSNFTKQETSDMDGYVKYLINVE